MQTYRFGNFELDLDALQLRLRDEPVRLERRPLDLLVLLVTRHGSLVPREEIIATLWPARVIIDFDSGLNTLVRKVRHALGDSSENPRFVETVPGRGYRFIAPVVAPLIAPAAVRDPALSPALPEQSHGRTGRRPGLVAAALSLLLAAGAAVLVWQGEYLDDSADDNAVHEPAATARDTRPALRVEPGIDRTLAVLPLRSPAGDEAAAPLAESVTDLLQDRLAALPGITVVAGRSISGLSDTDSDMRLVGERLQARLVLQGHAQQVDERLRVDLELGDAQSGRQLWSAAFERPLTEVAAIREEIIRRVSGVLDIPIEADESTRLASMEIDLDAYQVYLQGRRLLARSTATDTERAIELFRRATILDPGLARAYLGLGQALLERDFRALPSPRSAAVLDVYAGNEQPSDLRTQAKKAFDRALALNPALGEAWIEYARLSLDPVEAETLYRKGLQLAPNHGPGYLHYANFLFGEGRAGEAIDTISRARRIDPLTPELQLLHAFFLVVVRSDVAGHDRLVREALAINPRLPSALWQLAYSHWEYKGEFADAARIIERAIDADPRWHRARILARNVYLDLGDPVAATEVLGENAPPFMGVEIAQYRGDRRLAAALLENITPEDWQDMGARASMTEAIRDGAIASGDFAPAIKRLEAVFAKTEGDLPMWHRASSLVFAHTLVLAGEIERGRQLAESTLALVETHGVGRAENFFSRERAAAFAVLGADERALDELALSVRNGQLYRWWYLAGHDPLYERLRQQPRFRAIDSEARQHLDRQRAQLEALRDRGEVPARLARPPGRVMETR